MKRGIFVLALAAALASACAGPRKKAGPGPVEVSVAEGAAVYNDKDLAATRAAAVDEASRRALEAAAELFADPGLLASKREAFERSVLGSQALFVKKRAVLSESRLGGNYRARVKVHFYSEKLAAALRELGVSPGLKSGVTAALAVSEPGAEAGRAPAARAFSEVFASKSGIALSPLPAEKTGSREDALRAAGEAGARLLFFGRASADKAMPSGAAAGFAPSKAEVRLSILDAASGRSLGEVSASATAMDSTQELSLEKALAAAGELAGRDAAGRAAALSGLDYRITVRFLGVTGVERARKLKDALSRVRGLKAFALEAFGEGEVVFGVSPQRPDAQELASAILRDNSLPLELEQASQFDIVFRAGE